MQLPYFSVTNYGAYNSSTKTVQKERLISGYEFEFYTEDCEGGVAINSIMHAARKGCFTCSKPGQLQRMVLPYKCYFFNIYTQDEGLRELLDQMPDFSVLWNMDEVIKIFHELLTIESTSLTENRLLMESCVCRILSLVARSRPLALGKGADNTLLHRKNLQLADSYIRAHYTEDICLEDIAAQCGLHPNYFHRLYTAAFGKTPAQRLLSCRIAAAKTALLTTNLSISEIAAQCGFSSQTYFGYKFKESIGYTPLQYRKQLLSKR